MANYCVYSGGNGTSGVVAGSVPTATEWSNAYQSISACLTAITEVSGDIIFVAHDHSYTYSVNTNIYPLSTVDSGYVKILSIDRTNTTTATLLAGATEIVAATFSINFGQRGIYYGLTIQAGTGTSGGGGPGINSTGKSCQSVFIKCDFYKNNTSGSFLGFSSAVAGGSATLIECKTRGLSSTFIRVSNGIALNFINCTSEGTSKFLEVNGSAFITMEGCDFSSCSYLVDRPYGGFGAVINAVNCKLPSTIMSGTLLYPAEMPVELHSCSSSDINYGYYYRNGSGQITHDSGVYLTTGGASFTNTDGTSVPISLLTVSSVYSTFATPLKTPWFNVEVPSTGSKTFSVKIANTSSVLKDNEIWLELEYMGDATIPKITNVIDAPIVFGSINSPDILAAGTNRTDTAEAWTGISGEITHTLSKTVTVNQIGWARARVCLAKASTTIYVDPKVRIS